MVFAIKCWIENADMVNNFFFNIKNVSRSMTTQILIIIKKIKNPYHQTHMPTQIKLMSLMIIIFFYFLFFKKLSWHATSDIFNIKKKIR